MNVTGFVIESIQVALNSKAAGSDVMVGHRNGKTTDTFICRREQIAKHKHVPNPMPPAAMSRLHMMNVVISYMM